MPGLFKAGYEIWRSMETRDAYGGVVTTFAKLADVEGRAYPKRSDYARSTEFQYGVIQWTFACSSDTDIQSGDEVRFNGRRLSVDVVPVTSTGRRIEADCRELSGV